MWFAEKFVSLLIEQHHYVLKSYLEGSCDLLKNSYLCLLNNTAKQWSKRTKVVVICWKIRIFAYWTTPISIYSSGVKLLWFAEKFVSLLIEQHPGSVNIFLIFCCDLLKNSYLCLLNNTARRCLDPLHHVVICWKIRIFAYWTTPTDQAVIKTALLWFAEKFVSLLIEQHPTNAAASAAISCDLLKNSYLCLLNNTSNGAGVRSQGVVICWKIRIFAYWTTPEFVRMGGYGSLWFAEKFVSLLIEQHQIV